MSAKYLSHPSVTHVAARLAEAGHPHEVMALTDTARSAQEAAAALGVEVGAIVKTLMFVHGDDDRPVMALVAGDRQCDAAALAISVGSAAPCRRPDAARVKAATGYAIGGVSPIGLPQDLPVFIDSSLFRFDVVWSAAGHPHCVFQATPQQLQALCGGTVSDAIAPGGNAAGGITPGG